MQKDIMTVTDVEAARAIRSVQFLGSFLEPASPSDVAKLAKVAANLVHHHAKRCLDLGLLFVAKREGGKVFYQLAAKTFSVPRGLLEHDETIGATLQNLSSAFMQAYIRSDRLTSNGDPDFDLFCFDPQAGEAMTVGEPYQGGGEGWPAHFQAITMRLNRESYRVLIGKIAMLLAETKPENVRGAAVCTISVLGFAAPLEESYPAYSNESRALNSFVPGIAIGQASST
jgi:DNA-binding transcriptional ArsR family regulator